MQEVQRIVKGIWIPIEIWKDKNLTWNEKILFLEIDSYTSQETDCFFSNKYISELLGINETNASKTLSSLVEKGYVERTRFDGKRRYVRSALSFATTLPCRLRQPSRACDNIITTDNIKEDFNNTDYYKEKSDTNVSSKKKRFVKPTVEEIQAYITEKGFSFDAEAFYAYYESNGWKVGKNPMRNWKMACVTWSKNRNNNNTNNYGRETITDKIKRTVAEANLFSEKLIGSIGKEAELDYGDNEPLW